MNPKQLLAHFDRFSDAPDAVPRLRQLILDLAVRGKLVEQDPRDESASTFLGKHEFFPGQEKKPWKLPVGWAWSSFALIGDTVGGGTPSKTNPEFWSGPIPWVSPKDMKIEYIQDAQDHISQLAIDNSSARLISIGSLLMVVRGMILAHSFPTAITLAPVAINQDMKAIVPFRKDLSKFLLLISKGMKPNVMRLVLRSTHGTCKLLTEDLFSLPLPIPPLAEQKRIVTKVDELMGLCDRLEGAQKERETRRDRLAAASLNRLNNPDADAPTFQRHVRFHLNHLPRLTTRPDQIPQLRQTILNLAVRGKLVPQDPKDEPAPTFGIGDGSDREDRLLLSLPNGWSWTKVEDVGEARLGKMLDKAKNTGSLYAYLRNTNVHWFEFKIDEMKSLRIQDDEVDKFLLRDGDVLICEGGHGIGRTAIWRGEISNVVFQKALHRLRPGPYLNSDFFSFCVFVYFHQGILQRYFTGVGIPHFTGVALSKLVFPLPPLVEQKRIVAKVEELMGVCDRLEAQLTTTRTESRRLLEAILHEALAPHA